jgi:hypothetical protein
MYKNIRAATLILAVAVNFPVFAESKKTTRKSTRAVDVTGSVAPVLWRDPQNIVSRDLYFGAGGEAHKPQGAFTFVEEDRKGGSPKFVVEDERGIKWKAKLDAEAQSETVATRLIWAVGYFTDEDYFQPRIHVKDLPVLRRGGKFVEPDGWVRNVRMERQIKEHKKLGYWKWKEIERTREVNGLRVLMSLLNNWDLKDVNNAIYEITPNDGDANRIYVVSDLGATLGAPNIRMRLRTARNNLDAYNKSKFITKTEADTVDFRAPARPFLLYVFNVPGFIKRMEMRWIGRDIPREDAKWIGQLLAKLSPRQIRDAFRGAGYSPPEIEAFATVVERRIHELNSL